VDADSRLSPATLATSCGTPAGIARHEAYVQRLCTGCSLALSQGREQAFMSRLRAEAKSPPPPERIGNWTDPLQELIGVLAEAMYEHDQRNGVRP